MTRTTRANDDASHGKASQTPDEGAFASGELAFLSIAEAAELLRTRQLSPVELTRAVLERIDDLNRRLHAYITVTADWALERAGVAEREILEGRDPGPLHGIPLGLKDVYDTAGVVTTAGSRILAENLPTAHATAVARLLDAGAVIVGKHNLHEFAYGFTSANPNFGTPPNPWHPGHLAGGSSGGTAVAIASGLALGGMGTDTGGSVRVPASWCGISGLKPTYGRVSLSGIVPLSWSLDHAGPMARSAIDCALLLNAVAGYDADDVASVDRPVDHYAANLAGDLRGMRIGVIRDFLDHPLVAPSVAKAIAQAINILRGLGADLVETRLPEYAAMGRMALTILYAEASAYHARWVETCPEQYDPVLLDKLRRRSTHLAIPLAHAYRQRAISIRAADESMKAFDALVGPTTPFTAPRLEADNFEGIGSFTEPFNFNGLPALSVPAGFDDQGLPIGLMIVGRRWDERTVLQIGAAFQRATDWHRRRPYRDTPKG